MPNPEKERSGEKEEDKRQAIALQVPAADPPTLEKEEIGVPEKREFDRSMCVCVCVCVYWYGYWMIGFLLIWD
jgi:hypothetical protein